MSRVRLYRPWVWRVCLFLAPAAAVAAVELLNRHGLGQVGAWVLRAPGAALFTYAVFLGLIFVCTLLTRRLWVGYLIPTVPAVVFAVANYLKLSANGVPILLSELVMARQAGQLLGFLGSGLRVGPWAVFAVILAAGTAAVLFLFAYRPGDTFRGWQTRALVAEGVALALTLGIARPAPLGAPDPTQDQATRNAELGLLGGIYSSWLSREVDYGDDGRSVEDILLQAQPTPTPTPTPTPKPTPTPSPSGEPSQAPGEAPTESAEPSEEPPERAEPAAEVSGAPSPSPAPIETPTPTPEPTPEPTPAPAGPNVVMVMSESFVDVTRLFPQVSFLEDPLPNFHGLERWAQTGVFLSNTYGGGTGGVEMEVLTGFPSAFIPEGNDLCSLPGFPEVYERVPSVARVFAQAGYHTFYIHNYNASLFNRSQTIRRLGFETVEFERDFPADAPRSGPYLSDQALTDQIISAFETRTDGAPLFIYAVSMENHQPYSYDKFGGPSPLGTACDQLDETMLGMVDAVAWGVHGADAALGRLGAYLETLDEPTILIFWGDHKPGLYTDPGNSVFSALGAVPSADRASWDTGTLKYITETPLLVWNNYGAGFRVPAEVGNSGLGALALSWAGVEPDPYFRWVQQSIGAMRLYRSRLFVDGAGVSYAQPPAEAEGVVSDYRSLVRSYFS